MTTRVRAARTDVGVPQPRLAELAGVHTSTIKRIERGQRVGKRSRAAVADALIAPEPHLFAADGTALKVDDR